MKLFFLLAACMCISMMSFAQVGANILTPDPVAELDVVSPGNNTGVLIPIFTDAEMSAKLTPNLPPNGSLIFNSSKKRFMFNAGTAASPQWAFVGAAPLSLDVTTISSPIEGDLRYDLATNTMRFYNGTVWKTLLP